MPAKFHIASPFILSSTGFQYQNGRGQKPFRVSGTSKYAGIYLGFHHDNQLVAIHVGDVTLTAPKAETQVFRTPNVPQMSYAYDEVQSLQDDSDLALAEKYVREFHNSKCESLRIKNPEDSNMELEINALFKEWDQFAVQKRSARPAHARALVLAKELDIVARTITFEGHPLSMLEREKDETATPAKCKTPEDCPISSCEQRVVALTIRNRANHPQCKSQFGCRAVGDYFGVATKPSQFNIWMPSMTHRFIATCFLKDGIETAPPGNADFEAYRNRARQFRFALDASGRVLYGADWGIRNARTGTPLTSLTHYFHPRGMPGCDPDTYDRRYTASTRYVRTQGAKSDYALLLGKTVLMPAGTLPRETKAIIASALTSEEKAAAKKRGEKNISYEFIPFHPNGDSREWILETSGLSKITSSNVCLRGGLGALVGNPNLCPNADAQFYTAPRWGFQGSVEQMELTCAFESNRIVKLGGQCDSRMQPIGKVLGAHRIAPMSSTLY